MTPRAFGRNAIAAFFAIAVFAPVIWMLLDREPPYTRSSGRIEPSNPAPGDFISVHWNIRVERNCPPVVPRNINRTIIDSTGKYHDFEAVEGLYGTSPKALPGISRTLRLPKDITPGPAKYRSQACFACNPIHYFWPVCVSQPDIAFEISRP